MWMTRGPRVLPLALCARSLEAYSLGLCSREGDDEVRLAVDSDLICGEEPFTARDAAL